MRLLNDLRDLSKFESRRMLYEYCRHSIAAIVDVAVSEFAALAAERDVGVVVVPTAAPDAVAWCDVNPMGRVVRYLLSNAIKFTAEGRRVTISWEETRVCIGKRADDDRDAAPVWVRVADEGIGIPAHELDPVFDKFVQRSTTKSGAGGTGSGLAICREIVNQHGGRLWAENNRAGGACFVSELLRDPLNWNVPAQETYRREVA